MSYKKKLYITCIILVSLIFPITLNAADYSDEVKIKILSKYKNTSSDKDVSTKISRINMKIKMINFFKAKEAKKIKFLSNQNKEEGIELNSAKENNQYLNKIDISNKLKYKRIQQKSLSCELSAASDIISYVKKQNITENLVLKLLNKSYYNRLPIEKDNKIIWGNPNLGYVGYINKTKSGAIARQHKMTGYGVLEKPINKVYKNFGINTKIITNKNYSKNYNQKEHLTEILKELNNGNITQLWGDYCTIPKYEDTDKKNNCVSLYNNRTLTWYYEEKGNLVKYEGLSGEHAFYLLGYEGGVYNPEKVIVWDTQTGKHTYPINEWLRKWNLMQNRSIIIYK